MTDGQVVWICVADGGLSALSNSCSLLGRMDHLQQTKGDIEGLGHVFIEDRQSHVQRKTPDDSCSCLHSAARACSTSRRATGDMDNVRATSWPRADIFFQVFCTMSSILASSCCVANSAKQFSRNTRQI